MAAMQDPKIQQLVGQNPMAQTIQAAAMARINEHIAFEYRKQIEEQLGVPLPNMDEVLPEDVELEISKLMAQAASKLLSKDQAEVQQQQAEQQAQDPIIQMQQQELALKAQDLQIKAQKTMADIELDKAKLELDKAKLQTDVKLAGMELSVKTEMDKKKMQGEQLKEGLRMGVDASIKIGRAHV